MTTPKNVLITGNSSGLGLGLSQQFIEQGFHVYGCSRSGCPIEQGINDIYCDLSDFDRIDEALNQLLAQVSHLELVILNAGVLGEIKNISATSITELRQMMDLNTWSNKVILDWLLKSEITINQIILMSSGAAVLGNNGWNGYAISKAALNMLGRLYAHEFTHTHISAIAPGLIDSKMMDTMCTEGDSQRFPALQRIQQAKQNGKVLTPKQAAERILQALPHIKQYESGSFIDIRQILAPEEYEELMRKKTKLTK